MGRFLLLGLCLAALGGCLPAEPIVDPELPAAPEEGKGVFSVGVVCRGVPLDAPYALVGIQVDEQTSSGYRPYAYGVFSGGGPIGLELSEKSVYRLTASWVADTRGMYAEKGTYYEPFSLSDASGVSAGDRFVYSSSAWLDKLTLGSVRLADPKLCWRLDLRPELVRYAAEAVGVTARSGGAVELNFRSVSFSLLVEAPWLAAGRIEVQMDLGPVWALTPDNTTYRTQCTLLGRADRSAWLDEDYVDRFSVRAVWVRPNGARTALGIREFDAKREDRLVLGLHEPK